MCSAIRAVFTTLNLKNNSTDKTPRSTSPRWPGQRRPGPNLTGGSRGNFKSISSSSMKSRAAPQFLPAIHTAASGRPSQPASRWRSLATPLLERWANILPIQNLNSKADRCQSCPLKPRADSPLDPILHHSGLPCPSFK